MTVGCSCPQPLLACLQFIVFEEIGAMNMRTAARTYYTSSPALTLHSHCMSRCSLGGYREWNFLPTFHMLCSLFLWIVHISAEQQIRHTYFLPSLIRVRTDYFLLELINLQSTIDSVSFCQFYKLCALINNNNPLPFFVLDLLTSAP